MAKASKSNKDIDGAAAHGDPKYPYTLTPNSLRRFLEMVPNKPKPPKITGATLKVWGYKNTNDGTILRVLKKLDLLSSAGEPTNYYTEYMKKDVGAAILGQRIKIIYLALFDNVTNPEKATDEDLKNFFNIHSGGAEETIRLQIGTFKALAAYATFGDADPLAPEPSPINGGFVTGKTGSQNPTIRIDLHIHLPENKTKSDYDAILESIAQHLYQKKVSKFEDQAKLLADLAELRQKLILNPSGELSYVHIISALDQFMECVRYLNTRRSKGAKLNLENEADVQDALYLMLRPWITDLIYESPGDKVGNRFVIKDFLTKSAKTIIEAKFIRDESHGKQISKEIHDDIEMYRRHPDCDNLIFFVYDPNSLIPDVGALTTAILTKRVYDGRSLSCYLIIKP